MTTLAMPYPSYETIMDKSFIFSPSADFFEDEPICHLLKYKPWWVKAYAKKMDSQKCSPQDEFNQTAVGRTMLLILVLQLF